MLEENSLSSDTTFSTESELDLDEEKVQSVTFHGICLRFYLIIGSCKVFFFKVSHRLSVDRSKLVNIKCTEFSTESDVFLIELFGMHSDIDVRMAYTLLECGFDTYPTLSYCMITFPTNRRYFPLLNHFVVILIIN